MAVLRHSQGAVVGAGQGITIWYGPGAAVVLALLVWRCSQGAGQGAVEMTHAIWGHAGVIALSGRK